MNMTCANKDCCAELKYLRGGRLFLMERKPSAQTISPEAIACAKDSKGGAFPVPAMTQTPGGDTALLLVVRTLLANLFDPPLD